MTPLAPLLLATTNAGKIREIRRLLAHRPALVTLADLPPITEPEETGATFSENARLKASYYARQSHLTTVAEDSGLVVDALGGAPGVHSARYPGATYPDKFRNLYAALAPHPRPWTARYVCAVAVCTPDHELLYDAQATVEGEIWPEPRGHHGFGYDPIFFFPEHGRTFGELDDEEKLAVAHRGKAFRALDAWLETTRDEWLR